MNINVLDLVINEKLKQLKTEENYEENRLQLEIPSNYNDSLNQEKEKIEESKRVIVIEL